MEKKKSTKYNISVETDGKMYTGQGSTVHAALDSLKLSYTDVKYKGTITLKKGKKKAERFFYAKPLRRVIVNKLRKAQVGRDLESLLQ